MATTTQNAFVDLSGTSAVNKSNPYDVLIEDSENDPVQIQARYQAHRTARNSRQRDQLLSPSFTGMVLDPVLQKLLHPERYPGYVDQRHNLVFWARPSSSLRDLIRIVQQKLLTAVPNLWLMPIDCLHMTVLEITHSVTEPEVQKHVDSLQSTVQTIANYTLNHRPRLIKPMVGYDTSAIALSLVPAAGEGSSSFDDSYTYHHLRRDLYALCKDAGTTIASRYTVPSAHLTIARYVTQDDFSITHGTDCVLDRKKVERWVEALEKVNSWLEENYWPKKTGMIPDEGQWIVGQGKGLDFRKGVCWYGGGETVALGRGS